MRRTLLSGIDHYIDHCLNVQKLLALTTQPNVESKILFLAQYSCPYAKEFVGLEFVSLSLRCWEDLNRIHSKLDHLKVNTYQLDRCVIHTMLNASVWMQRDFGYPVLIRTSKFSYFILELVPTIDVQDFMGHPLFSSELIEGEATIYIVTSSTPKMWSVASIWQSPYYTAFIPVFSGQSMVPMARNIITVFIFSVPCS